MVTRSLLTVLLLLTAVPALGKVVASIDRAMIDANESFNLSVSVDNMRSVEPDISVVLEDFEVLGSQESNNTRIFNGEITQQRLFTYQLMPKREGVLEIPAITVGQESSTPLSITVRAPDTTSAAGRDIFVEAAVDRTSTWVQAQIILSIRVYRAALVRQDSLRDPTFDGPEVLIQRFGKDRSFSKQIDGQTYDVFERRFALYPQASGELTIGEFVYSGRIWQRSRLSSRRLFRSEPLQVEVQPIPPPPALFPDAAWLPASDVRLEQRWNPDSREFAAGEPVTRELRLSATGLMASQLPPLNHPAQDGVRVYPDQPELTNLQSERGLVGQRVERYAVIASQAGRYDVPAMRLPWWNVNEGRWNVAELPAVELSVARPPDAEPEPVAGTAAPIGQAAASVAAVASARPWQWATASVGGLWVLTVLAWWLSRRSKNRPAHRKTLDPARLGERRRLLRDARRAAEREDFPTAAASLRNWAALEFGGGPWSLSSIAARLDAPAADALRVLNQTLYGRGGPQPSAAALGRAIGSLSQLPGSSASSAGAASGLAPLSPLPSNEAQ
ncbi:MAG: BatD family protein [Pseudomonadota bacterium]